MGPQDTFKEQMESLLTDSIEKYPDAIRWVMQKLDGVVLSDIQTDYEKFVERLAGDGPFDNHPYSPVRDNFVDLIKWYRNKHSTSLKIAKGKCDAFVQDNYYDSDRGKRARGEPIL